MKLKTSLLIALAFLTGCRAGGDWQVVRGVDEFTDERICRIEQGSSFTRSFQRGVLGAGISYHLFVEQRDGDLRVGLRSEPLLPIPGDIQLRVDNNEAVTITAADTPIDLVANSSVPGVGPEGLVEEITANVARMTSPYRALAGEPAETLLRQIEGGQLVIYRVLANNAASSGTGRVEITPRLAEALQECVIRYPTSPGA